VIEANISERILMLPQTLDSTAPQGPGQGPAPTRARDVFAVDWLSAARAATLAALAITVYMMFVPRWLGYEEMDIGITVGELTAFGRERLALLSRLAWHFGNGLVYVAVYAIVLRRLGQQSNLGTGVIFGIILWLVGPMLLIPLLLNLAPAVSWGLLTNPGIFMLDLGLGWKPAVTDLGAHLVHGIVTGVVYKHKIK
jgi:hypothetical protein